MEKTMIENADKRACEISFAKKGFYAVESFFSGGLSDQYHEIDRLNCLQSVYQKSLGGADTLNLGTNTASNYLQPLSLTDVKASKSPDHIKAAAGWASANPSNKVVPDNIPGFNIEKNSSGNEVKRGFVNSDGSSHMEFPDGVRVDEHVDGTATLSQNINGYSDTTYRKADGTMEKVMDGLVIDLRLTGELEINGQPTEMKSLLGEVFNRPKYENRFPKSSDFDRLK